MDATPSIKIDRNVEMPGRSGRNSLAKYPWHSMAVGDSFLFPAGMSAHAASSNANSAQLRTGFKFSYRTTEEGIRCWRIA